MESSSAAPSAASAAAGLLTSAIVVDAAVETWISGSPLRLWLAIAALAWLLGAAILWRMKARWYTQLAGGALTLLAVLAITAWRPEGLDHGLRMLRLPTATMASWSTALALAAAAIICLRATAIPLVVRGVVALFAVYGIVTFAFGGWQAVGYAVLLHGSSPWRLPVWLLRGAIVCGLVVLPIALAVSALGGLAQSGRVWRPRQIVALVLALLLVVSGFTTAATPLVVRLELAAPQTSASATPPAMTPASAPIVGAAPAQPDAGVVSDAVSTVGTLTGPASTTSFDVNRKADEIGNDPAALFTFVHDTINTQVYPGVLRGARGTLVAGAGNAWDQAMLLAELLRHHGRAVRFATGRLAPADATAIVDRMFADASRQRPPAAALPAVPDSIRTQGAALVARVNAAWLSAHADVVTALTNAGLTLGDASPSDAVLNAEAADHAWVEYRDGDRWIPLDPVARTRPGEAAAAASETMTEIADAHQHRVTIRFKLETRRGQTLKTTDLLTCATTAAALDGTPAAIALEVEQGGLAAWRARPILQVGERTLGQRWFTEAGPIFGSGRSTIVGEASQQVGQLGSVTEAFGGPPAPSAVEMTAAWIEVEFASPAGVTDTVRRDVFDRIGAAARGEGRAATATLRPLARVGEIPAALNGVYGLAFTSGALDPAVVWEPLAAEKETIDQALSPGAVPQKASKGLRAVPRILWSSAAALHVLSRQLSAQLRSPSGPAVFYEATPRLAIASLEIVPAASNNGRPTASIALDLRRNGLRAVVKGASAADAARVNLARGVLDGAIEDAVVAQLAAALDPRPATVVSLLARARADGIAPVAWRGDAAVRGYALADDPRARLQAVANDTTAIVAAPRAVPSAAGARAGWWQIDLRSGEATAMLDDGLHGARARIGQDEEEEPLVMVVYLPLEGGPIANSWEAAQYGSWIGPIIVGVIVAIIATVFGLIAK
jgi:hypothetical protein